MAYQVSKEERAVLLGLRPTLSWQRETIQIRCGTSWLTMTLTESGESVRLSGQNQLLALAAKLERVISQRDYTFRLGRGIDLVDDASRIELAIHTRPDRAILRFADGSASLPLSDLADLAIWIGFVTGQASIFTCPGEFELLGLEGQAHVRPGVTLNRQKCSQGDGWSVRLPAEVVHSFQQKLLGAISGESKDGLWRQELADGQSLAVVGADQVWVRLLYTCAGYGGPSTNLGRSEAALLVARLELLLAGSSAG